MDMLGSVTENGRGDGRNMALDSRDHVIKALPDVHELLALLEGISGKTCALVVKSLGLENSSRNLVLLDLGGADRSKLSFYPLELFGGLVNLSEINILIRLRLKLSEVIIVRVNLGEILIDVVVNLDILVVVVNLGKIINIFGEVLELGQVILISGALVKGLGEGKENLRGDLTRSGLGSPSLKGLLLLLIGLEVGSAGSSDHHGSESEEFHCCKILKIINFVLANGISLSYDQKNVKSRDFCAAINPFLFI